jgi:thiamine-monophosphate kinase
MSGRDEFGEIARLFRPLTHGAPAALGLLDDAAVLPSRPGHELVITQDGLVEGVHVLEGADPALIARKLLRVNLSDLAAKAAEPFAALLTVGWSERFGAAERGAFAGGLAQDLAAFGVDLLGGDTVRTTGPFWASLTALGWAPAGRMVTRGGAKPGDHVLVSGTIGDGVLGLAAARGELSDADGFLRGRLDLPTPRLELRQVLRDHATAAADVSDGLIADARHIAEASGARIVLDLDRTPLSQSARRWLEAQPDKADALLRLVSGGDDYEIVCAMNQGASTQAFTPIGRVEAGSGLGVLIGGQAVDAGAGGWRHI